MADSRARRQQGRRGPRGKQATHSNGAAQTPEQTDNWFPTFADAAFEGLVIHEDGVILDANQVAAEAIGRTRSELIGRHAQEFIAPEYRDSLRQALAAPSDVPVEAVCARKDGSTFPVEIRGRPISYDGRMVRVASIRDITERKRAEEALLESEARYRQIFEHIRDVYYRADANGIITEISPSVERYGLTRGQFIGRSVLDIYANPEDRAAHLQALAEQEEVVDYELRMRAPDGREGYVSESARVLRGDDGSIVGYEGVLRNITERKQAEEALRESEAKFRHLFENVHDVYFRTGLNDVLMDVSPSIEKYGYRPDEIIGTKIQDAYEDPEERAAIVSRLLEEGEVEDYELRMKARDGRLVDVSLNARVARGPDGQPIAFEGTLRDITEHKRKDDALRESEEKYRTLVQCAADGIAVAQGLEVKFVNQAMLRMFGIESEAEVLGRSFTEFLTQGHRQFVLDRVQAGREPPPEPCLYEEMGLRRDGTEFPIEVYVGFITYEGKPAHQVIIRDITERKRAEEEIRRREQELRVIAENVPALFSYVDAEGRYRFVNKQYEEWFGVPRAEIIGKHYREVLGEAAYEQIGGRVQEALSGQQVSYEDTLPYAHGGPRCVLGDYVPDTDDQGRVRGFFALVTDITERKQAEEALRESEQRVRTLSEAAFEAIAITDNGRILDANQALAALSGYDLAELVGMEAVHLAAPEYRELVAQNMHSGHEEPYEIMGLRKDGKTVPVEIRGAAIPYRSRVARVAAIRDISERKRVEEAFQRAREELEDRVERQMQRGNGYGLTFRELTVLHLVAAGKSDKEIGVTLGISPLTARKHVEHILAKMESPSRTEASVRALKEGLLGSPEPQPLELRWP